MWTLGHSDCKPACISVDITSPVNISYSTIMQYKYWYSSDAQTVTLPERTRTSIYDDVYDEMHTNDRHRIQ